MSCPWGHLTDWTSWCEFWHRSPAQMFWWYVGQWERSDVRLRTERLWTEKVGFIFPKLMSSGLKLSLRAEVSESYRKLPGGWAALFPCHCHTTAPCHPHSPSFLKSKSLRGRWIFCFKWTKTEKKTLANSTLSKSLGLIEPCVAPVLRWFGSNNFTGIKEDESGTLSIV